MLRLWLADRPIGQVVIGHRLLVKILVRDLAIFQLPNACLPVPVIVRSNRRRLAIEVAIFLVVRISIGFLEMRNRRRKANSYPCSRIRVPYIFASRNEI